MKNDLLTNCDPDASPALHAPPPAASSLPGPCRVLVSGERLRSQAAAWTGGGRRAAAEMRCVWVSGQAGQMVAAGGGMGGERNTGRSGRAGRRWRRWRKGRGGVRPDTVPIKFELTDTTTAPTYWTDKALVVGQRGDMI